MKFETLINDNNLLKAISELGFENPTEVQALAIPRVLDKKDLIVMAKTGSGKTGAFSLPVLEQLTEEKRPQVLILAPTRELAVQVCNDIKLYTKYAPIKATPIYGGHNMQKEIQDLKSAKVVVGTPGRVIHHIKEGNLKTKGMKYLVLDEADRMLDMGFIDQIHKIIQSMPRQRQTLLFSATMPPEIQRICTKYMNEPEAIELDSDTKTVDTIDQFYLRVEANEKRKQLKRLIYAEKPKSCMIFCNMRVDVDRVHQYLFRNGIVSEAIHGANTQNKRMRTIQEFKDGKIQVLVATDVAARGIHIDDMALVINYDVPQDKDSYIHRIGRTGRAGSGGRAISMVTSDDIYALYEVEEHAGARIDEMEAYDEEVVSKGQAQLNDIWQEIYNARKARHDAAAKDKKPRERKHTDRHKQNRKPNQDKRRQNNRRQHASDKRHDNRHRTPDRREHPKMHQEPVRRVIEKNFVPINQPKQVAVIKKEEKKKFSLKSLFRKKS
ncbi:DEAD/DEAH box helicase [Acidaminobacter sp. JC074]|uniref:DEAD/DEAH box helicase n=1 Tax=Acidaminobacter sp. JC074 TaxID=2530199 RepID=UPI001F100824|nr:DEAD/DEAH box helicase [Acidaminobacter sp. JC074]MCH4890811.1 DEAD/DEAH box helicase [Acidaminobacter sp. JC074]